MDTVGSLGIPKMPPFYHSGRGDEEVCTVFSPSSGDWELSTDTDADSV